MKLTVEELMTPGDRGAGGLKRGVYININSYVFKVTLMPTITVSALLEGGVGAVPTFCK
jgi:hypothetical protein